MCIKTAKTGRVEGSTITMYGDRVLQLTKREALEKCIEQWQYLADTGTSYKEEYFKEKEISDKDWPYSLCYCCEYDQLMDRKDAMSEECDNCPLMGYAWDKGCTEPLSVYDEWENLAYAKDRYTPQKEAKRKHYAQIIADSARWALEDLDAERETLCAGCGKAIVREEGSCCNDCNNTGLKWEKSND